ncbi:MAG TPA: hypothetical protein VME46_20245 [Acidimicrobiales bacterium]|nr:hypothetical protein [Acidimicrobiales bacterium]
MALTIYPPSMLQWIVMSFPSSPTVIYPDGSTLRSAPNRGPLDVLLTIPGNSCYYELGAGALVARSEFEDAFSTLRQIANTKIGRAPATTPGTAPTTMPSQPSAASGQTQRDISLSLATENDAWQSPAWLVVAVDGRIVVNEEDGERFYGEGRQLQLEPVPPRPPWATAFPGVGLGPDTAPILSWYETLPDYGESVTLILLSAGLAGCYLDAPIFSRPELEVATEDGQEVICHLPAAAPTRANPEGYMVIPWDEQSQPSLASYLQGLVHAGYGDGVKMPGAIVTCPRSTVTEGQVLGCNVSGPMTAPGAILVKVLVTPLNYGFASNYAGEVLLDETYVPSIMDCPRYSATERSVLTRLGGQRCAPPASTIPASTPPSNALAPTSTGAEGPSSAPLSTVASPAPAGWPSSDFGEPITALQTPFVTAPAALLTALARRLQGNDSRIDLTGSVIAISQDKVDPLYYAFVWQGAVPGAFGRGVAEDVKGSWVIVAGPVEDISCPSPQTEVPASVLEDLAMNSGC